MTKSKTSLTGAAPTDGRPAVARARKHRIGSVVAASLGAGLVTATALAVVVFAGGEEHVITGTVMLAFALGWALLAACSARWTDQEIDGCLDRVPGSRGVLAPASAGAVVAADPCLSGHRRRDRPPCGGAAAEPCFEHDSGAA